MGKWRLRRGSGVRRATAVAAAAVVVCLPLLSPPAAAQGASETKQGGEKPAAPQVEVPKIDAPLPPDRPVPGNGTKPGRGRPPAAPLAAPDTAAPAAATHPATADGSPVFIDATAAVGLDFVHDNGMIGELWFGEVVGSGAALFDVDGDGDLDAFLVQGGPLGAGADGADAEEDATGEGSALPPPGHRLYRNLLAESGKLAFADVTAESGIAGGGYGMGAAVGDVDGDGDLDLYVTALGPNRLWLNRGDGTFSDGTDAWRADDPRWSTAASFFDADLDGDLDLFVGNYVAWTPAHPERCHAQAGYRDYCGPLNYPPAADRLLENRGDRFVNATAVAGIGASFGGALGALAHDLVGDPRPEIYVANDASANQLWSPAGDAGGYRDLALENGVALNGAGQPEGSMGVDLGDYDGDGDLDLVVVHVHHETNTLYDNDGAGGFSDATERAGLGPPSRGLTGFGAGFLDYDGDGWLDLAVVNGTVTLLPDLAAAGDPYPLHQKNQLFRNLGGDGGGKPVRYADVSASAGEAFAHSEVSRGAAFGDVDDDGDLDLLIANSNGPARLLLNRAGDGRRWLGLRLLTAGGEGVARRDDHGARASVELTDGRRLLRRVRVDGSYLSAHDPRLLFGLGEAAAVRAVTVRWADGAEERWEWAGRPLGAYVTLVRGSGTPTAGRPPG